MLLLLDSPSSGAVTFRGKPAAELSATELAEFRRAVQPVFQNPFSSLDPRMRVGRIIAEPLTTIREFSRADIDRRIAEVLQAVQQANAEAAAAADDDAVETLRALRPRGPASPPWRRPGRAPAS